jgi:hypothetical protein
MPPMVTSPFNFCANGLAFSTSDGGGGKRGAPEFHAFFTYFGAGISTNSTRRFFDRPSSVLFVATGEAKDTPTGKRKYLRTLPLKEGASRCVLPGGCQSVTEAFVR